MAIVIICFTLENIALYLVLPKDVLGETNAVAVVSIPSLGDA